MRAGYKYVDAETPVAERSQVDATPDEFAQTMGYGDQHWASRDAFLADHSDRWVLELHAVLVDLLEQDRSILSVGSGVGEHDVRLALAGYDVTASDVVTGVLDRTSDLFPELKTRAFDVFAPGDARSEDVLVTGMDSYFDDADALRMMQSLAAVAGPGGRVLFTLRYPDNPATLVIDRVLLPAGALVQRLRGRRVVRKHHGWRRSRRDILRLAAAAGLEPGRIRTAALGYEAARVGIDPDRFRRLDRRTGLLASATVIELHVR